MSLKLSYWELVVAFRVCRHFWTVGRRRVQRKLIFPADPGDIRDEDKAKAGRCLESFAKARSSTSKQIILNESYMGLGDMYLPVAEAMLIQWATGAAAILQTIIRVLSNPETASLIQEFELDRCVWKFTDDLRKVAHNAYNVRSIRFESHFCSL
jgi:hypothetical protein